MNSFGVCRYDFDGYEPKTEDLKLFDTYEDAYDYYISLVRKMTKKSCFHNSDLWIVYIDENNRIVQFEQLQWKIKCKLVELDLGKEE